jgi:hypothetical protein
MIQFKSIFFHSFHICNKHNLKFHKSFSKIIEVVPALGESITEGTIQKWLKNVGDQVKVDDVIAIVETDKVTVDIKSSNPGVIVKHLANENVSRELTLLFDRLFIVQLN